MHERMIEVLKTARFTRQPNGSFVTTRPWWGQAYDVGCHVQTGLRAGKGHTTNLDMKRVDEGDVVITLSFTPEPPEITAAFA